MEFPCGSLSIIRHGCGVLTQRTCVLAEGCAPHPTGCRRSRSLGASRLVNCGEETPPLVPGPSRDYVPIVPSSKTRFHGVRSQQEAARDMNNDDRKQTECHGGGSPPSRRARDRAICETGNDLNQKVLIRLATATVDEKTAFLEGRSVASCREAPSGPLTMTMSDAARYAGVSRATLYRMLQENRLRRVEIRPGTFRVIRADLHRLLGGAS